MTFKPYPKYKASGVEWLGEVPEGWVCSQLKRGYQVALGKMLQPEPKSETDIEVPYLRAANIQWDHVDVSDVKSMYASKKEIDSLRLEEGDLLVSEGGDVGRSAIWREEISICCIQNSVNRIRAREGNSNRYLFYWLRMIKEAAYIDVLCNKSTIAHFTAEKVEAVPVAFPPKSEQLWIATFLDRETAKIDTLIAKQEAMILLLKEKRQAVISHAVTKGLDPSVAMKASGVEWLGDVPEHWEVTRLGWVANEINDINHQMPAAVENGVPFLSAKDLLDSGGLNFIDNIKQISEEDFEILSKKILPRRNDIIYSRIGARLGKARLVETDVRFLVSYSCCVVRVHPVRAIPPFICMLLDTDLVLTEAKARTNGIGVPDLGLDEIARFPVPLPPISEQEEIVAFLNQQTALFSKLISKAQQAIALQKEHRSALISAAVTGKIDVRGEVEERKAA